MEINRNKKILAGLLSVLILFILLLPVISIDAATANPGESVGTGSKIEPPIKNTDLKGLLITILDKIVIKIGTVIAILSLIYSGYLFVSATGDPGKVGKAREHFTWTIVGIAILLGAKAIVVLVTGTIESVTGYNIGG